MAADNPALLQEAHHLAYQLFGDRAGKVSSFTDRLLDTCTRARGKDFLLVHNPGGWGTNTLEQCLQWEKSIVTGIGATIERLGYSQLLVQYFRSGNGWREQIRDIREQYRFFATKARVMAAELEFITQHIDNLKVVLIGISQGAAFTNSVMQQLTRLDRVYSIEFGMFFPHISRRVITERTLVLDSNGLVPDAAVRLDIMAVAKAYMVAPFRWVKHLLKARLVRFGYCVRVRGHDYDWGYPQVRQQVVDFLETNFGTK